MRHDYVVEVRSAGAVLVILISVVGEFMCSRSNSLVVSCGSGSMNELCERIRVDALGGTE
jgi:hypothetical protein